MENNVVIRNKKVVYFADPILSCGCETIEDECDEAIIFPLKNAGIEFEKIHCVDSPPFGKMLYDILFFDFGGMSMGNSLMESYCRHIINEAEDFPNRAYVMVSSFTEYAMNEAMDYFGRRDNIFLKLSDFLKHIKDNGYGH